MPLDPQLHLVLAKLVASIGRISHGWDRSQGSYSSPHSPDSSALLPSTHQRRLATRVLN